MGGGGGPGGGGPGGGGGGRASADGLGGIAPTGFCGGSTGECGRRASEGANVGAGHACPSCGGGVENDIADCAATLAVKGKVLVIFGVLLLVLLLLRPSPSMQGLKRRARKVSALPLDDLPPVLAIR